VELGADGVLVSNHGGRQLDLAPSPMEVLPAIRAALDPSIAVLFDSGIRRGSHGVAAMGLCADLGFAAYRLFAAHGLDNVTTEHIAAAAGVSPSTFFRYTATKEELLLDPVRRGWSAIAALLEARPLCNITTGVAQPPDVDCRRLGTVSGLLGEVLMYQTSFFRNSDLGQWRYYDLTADITPQNIDWPMFLGPELGLAPNLPFRRRERPTWRVDPAFGPGQWHGPLCPPPAHGRRATGMGRDESWGRPSQETGLPRIVNNRTGRGPELDLTTGESVGAAGGERLFSFSAGQTRLFYVDWDRHQGFSQPVR